MLVASRTSALAALCLVAACQPQAVDVVIPANQLVDTQTLAVGDEDCPGGGVRIRTGLDDGEGGGTAADGILQPGEVDSSDIVCTPVAPVVEPPASIYASVEAPDGPAGTAVINLSGGTGKLGNGGSGGAVRATTGPRPSPYGHIAAFHTGRANTTHNRPPDDVDLGTAPWVLSADDTLFVVADRADAPPGSRFTTNEAFGQIRETDTNTRVTGVHVPKGITLTVEAINSFASRIELAGVLVVDGTIEVPVLPLGDTADLQLDVGHLVVGSDGFIDLRGTDVSDGPGGDGGSFTIKTGRDLDFPFIPGTIVFDGTVDTSAGAGSPAGDAGRIDVETELGLWAAGTWRAHGGDGVGEGLATDAATMQFTVEEGLAAFQGTFEANAGQGGTVGALGATIEIISDRIILEQTFTSSGGTPTACLTTCKGGRGGWLKATATGGPILAHLQATAHGGDGIGEVGTEGAVGGAGGTITLWSGQANADLLSYQPRVELSGDIAMMGGAGTKDGGFGGVIDLKSVVPFDKHSEVRLLGYDRIVTQGGNTTAGIGGPGGNIRFRHGENFDVSASPSGGIILGVDVDAMGGTGSTGGRGGSISLDNTAAGGISHDARRVRVLSAIDLSGATGNDVGGHSGQMSAYGAWGILLEGSILSRAGDALNLPGRPGDAGINGPLAQGLTLNSSRGHIDIDGSILYEGGSHPDIGGNGAFVGIAAPYVTVHGDISSIGGVASDGIGGNGGYIVISSSLAPTVHNQATFDVSGGDGRDIPGVDGAVFIDQMPQQAD